MRITNTIIKKNDHIVETVNRNLKNVELNTNPFNHWIFNKVLPIKTAEDFTKLLIDVPEISFFTGKIFRFILSRRIGGSDTLG